MSGDEKHLLIVIVQIKCHNLNAEAVFHLAKCKVQGY